MKMSSPKRILAEDFEPDERQMVNKIAECYNVFAEDVYNLLSKNLSITDNLTQELKTIQRVKVDGMGTPLYTLSFKNSLKTKIQGMQVVRVFGGYPTSQPFISWVENNGIVEIKNITGLNTGLEYTLVIHLMA